MSRAIVGVPVLLKHIRQGKARAPHCTEAIPALCPRCGTFAILPLDQETRAKQPDETVFVCHAVLGGCNVGFALFETPGLPDETPAKAPWKRGDKVWYTESGTCLVAEVLGMDVKNGRPIVDVQLADGSTVWGYLDQIKARRI